MLLKPVCKVCGRIYLSGQDGCCNACLADQPRKRSPRRIVCYCGRLAVAVLLAEVISPENEAISVEIPVCRLCLKLEAELEALETRPPPARTGNPAQVIVVKRLPRPKRPLKGTRV